MVTENMALNSVPNPNFAAKPQRTIGKRIARAIVLLLVSEHSNTRSHDTILPCDFNLLFLGVLCGFAVKFGV